MIFVSLEHPQLSFFLTSFVGNGRQGIDLLRMREVRAPGNLWLMSHMYTPENGRSLAFSMCYNATRPTSHSPLPRTHFAKT